MKRDVKRYDQNKKMVTWAFAYELANEQMFTIALQCRRLRTDEPEDETFVLRVFADLQFLILSLYRLRRAVQIAGKFSDVTREIDDAVRMFDHEVPNLKKLRDIGEHLDSYVVDDVNRHRKDVTHRDLLVGAWDYPTYEWLGVELNVEVARKAAEELFEGLRGAITKRGWSVKDHWV